ncbi:hypothetical protein EUTSA_v10028109mg, partial [Eutrema salsugineum]
GQAYWFDQKNPTLGYRDVLPLTKLLDINGGFLVNGEVKIAAEVDFLEVIGKSDMLEETSLVMDVKGFQVLPSQSLRRWPKKIFKDDLSDAEATLANMTNVGFKLDWLEKKLDQVKESKEKEEAGEIQMQKIEEDLKDLKHKCSELEAQLEKEKAELLASRATLSLSDDDVI